MPPRHNLTVGARKDPVGTTHQSKVKIIPSLPGPNPNPILIVRHSTGGKTLFREKAPDIEFVKTRTSATGSTPSQIVYAVRVKPHMRAATAPPGMTPENRPAKTMKRKKKKRGGEVKMSEMDLKLQALRLEREEKRRSEEEHGRYQDQVIRQWLMEKAETENARLRREQSTKLRERKKMEEDRKRIEMIEEELLAQEAQEEAAFDESQAFSSPSVKPKTKLSTSQYLQRQRQLLLEDYLRKHMSLPLQARSPVLAGLEQLQPPRRPSSEMSGSKTREELLNQLNEMENVAKAGLSPLPAIGS